MGHTHLPGVGLCTSRRHCTNISLRSASSEKEKKSYQKYLRKEPIMNRENAKHEVKMQLESYLSSKGINPRKPFRCLNPSHTDKHPSMTVYKAADGYPHCKCQSCQAHYDTFDLIGLDYGLSDDTAIFEQAYSYFNLNLDTPAATPPKKEPVKTNYESGQSGSSIDDLEEAVKVYDFTDIMTAAHAELLSNAGALAYLETRGISRELIEKYKIGYHNEGYNHLLKAYPELQSKSRKQNLYKYVLPYMDKDGCCRYFLTEIIDRTQVDEYNGKYRKISGMRALIFNEKYLQEPDNHVIFLCEGIYDALSIEEVGGKAMALVGVGNRRFLSLCKKYEPKYKFIICLDNDPRGKEATESIKKGLDELHIPYEVRTAANGKDANENLQENRPQFEEYIGGIIDDVEAELLQEQEAEREKLLQEYRKNNTKNYVNGFIAEMQKPENTTFYPTGFSSLDELLDGGLYKGLYCIGAISSLGKTTFCLQVIDQIAQQGHDVLIFSLEMARFELMAKSLSRNTYIESLENYGNSKYAKTTRGLMSGSRYSSYSIQEMQIIHAAMNRYSQYAEHIFIHEGVGNIGVEEVAAKVKEHKELTGKAPVVLIDYLQILAPFSEHATDKQNTDKAVLELKRISRDYHIPVIGISSFNRDNYTAPVNMASFKESGAVEYSSDVLLALQYDGMDYKKGTKTDRGGNQKEAYESKEDREARVRKLMEDMQEKGRNGEAQKIQVKILKNRNGSKGDCCLEFVPMFNHFQECKAAGTATGTLPTDEDGFIVYDGVNPFE